MAKPKPKRGESTLWDQLREAIESSGLTHYRLGKLAAVPEITISRYVRYERDIRTETAGRLMRALGARLVVQRKAQRKAPPGLGAERGEGPGT